MRFASSLSGRLPTSPSVGPNSAIWHEDPDDAPSTQHHHVRDRRLPGEDGRARCAAARAAGPGTGSGECSLVHLPGLVPAGDLDGAAADSRQAGIALTRVFGQKIRALVPKAQCARLGGAAARASGSGSRRSNTLWARIPASTAPVA